MLYTNGPMMDRMRMQLNEDCARTLDLHRRLLQAYQMLYPDELITKLIR